MELVNSKGVITFKRQKVVDMDIFAQFVKHTIGKVGVVQLLMNGKVGSERILAMSVGGLKALVTYIGLRRTMAAGTPIILRTIL